MYNLFWKIPAKERHKRDISNWQKVYGSDEDRYRLITEENEPDTVCHNTILLKSTWREANKLKKEDPT